MWCSSIPQRAKVTSSPFRRFEDGQAHGCQPPALVSRQKTAHDAVALAGYYDTLPTMRRPLLLSFLLLTPACGSVIIEEAAPEEKCVAMPAWQLEFPGEAGPLFHSSLLRDDTYIASGASFEGVKEGTSVVSIDPDGAQQWQFNLVQQWSEMTSFAAGVVLAGSTYSSNGPGLYPPDIDVSAYSSQGTFSWSTGFGTDEEDYVSSVVADDNNIFVVGSKVVFSGADADLIIGRLDHAGSLDWLNTYGKPTTGWKDSNDERPISAAIDSEGRLVVAAQRWLNGGGGPPWVFAVDQQGNIVWEYLDATSYDRGTDWVFLPMRSGGFVISGYVYSKSSFYPGPARVVRLNSDGTPRWITSLDDGSDNQQLTSVGVELPDGSFILAGYTAESTHAHAWKIDPDGKVVWSRDFDDDVGFFSRARVLPDGGIALLANKTDYSTHTGTYQVLRLGPNGDTLWNHSTSHYGLVFDGDLTVRPNGNIVMAGRFSFEGEKHGRLLELTERCQP
jgi:hypothetical protein